MLWPDPTIAPVQSSQLLADGSETGDVWNWKSNESIRREAVKIRSEEMN